MATLPAEALLTPDFLDFDTAEEPDPLMDAPPGDDVPVAPYDNMGVIQAVIACLEESEDARAPRDSLGDQNQDAAHSRQVFDGKIKGQSTEFIPKVPLALEQFSSLVESGLTGGGGDYFAVTLTPNPELTGSPLSEGGVVKLMRHRLETPEELPPCSIDFPTLVGDATKVGLLEALMVFKVHGVFMPTRRLTVTPSPETGEDELRMEEKPVWKLLVELIRPKDYFPDPTGRALYEIHRTRMDLYQVIALSEGDEPEYDREAVLQLTESFRDGEVEADLANETDQLQDTSPGFRKEVEILEFWGTLLDSDGSVAHANCRCAIANRRYLIRRPEPNPFWHQDSPFVAIAPLRVPFSVFHKALFDYAVRLNFAYNELYNLIQDGAIGAVWGNRQIKMSRVRNADQFTDGVGQGAVFDVAEEHPDGVPVMLNTPSGVVPPESLQVLGLLDREFNAATLLSSTAKGETPRKEVSATATASADQSSDKFIGSIVGRIEKGLSKVLRLAWLTMLQNSEEWGSPDTAGCIGPQATAFLEMLSPAQRFKQFGEGCAFRVSGISAMLARNREFQKVIAAIGAFSQSPVLLQAFFMKYSPDKIIQHMLKALNLDPEDLRITPEEQQALQERMVQLQMFAGGGGPGMAQPQMGMQQQPGSPTQAVQADVAQMNQPPQGL